MAVLPLQSLELLISQATSKPGSITVEQLKQLRSELSGPHSIIVAYNSTYGGFALSRYAATKLQNLGALPADQKIERYNHTELARNDPRLISVIQELGEFASPYGSMKLAIVDAPSIDELITDHDGLESVHAGTTIEFPPEKTYWGAFARQLYQKGFSLIDGYTLQKGPMRCLRHVTDRSDVLIMRGAAIDRRIDITDTAHAADLVCELYEEWMKSTS